MNEQGMPRMIAGTVTSVEGDQVTIRQDGGEEVTLRVRSAPMPEGVRQALVQEYLKRRAEGQDTTQLRRALERDPDELLAELEETNHGT